MTEVSSPSPVCRCYQMPPHNSSYARAGLFSPINPSAIFLLPFSPPRLYMTSTAAYLAPGEGPVCISVSLNLK